MNALIVAEQSRLDELEAVIDHGLQTFVEVGLALSEIRDSRLYKRTHPTFEAYCSDRWKFKASRGRQLIAAAELARDLQSVTGVTVPDERTARGLIPLARAKGLGAVAEKLTQATPASDRRAYERLWALPDNIHVNGSITAAWRADKRLDDPPVGRVTLNERELHLGGEELRARLAGLAHESDDPIATFKAIRKMLQRIDYECACALWCAEEKRLWWFGSKNGIEADALSEPLEHEEEVAQPAALERGAR